MVTQSDHHNHHNQTRGTGEGSGAAATTNVRGEAREARRKGAGRKKRGARSGARGAGREERGAKSGARGARREAKRQGEGVTVTAKCSSISGILGSSSFMPRFVTNAKRNVFMATSM